MFSDKWKDVEQDQHPAFDAALWKEVLDGRDVGFHHKQALGGLDPNFHSFSSSSSTVHSTAASTVEATPPIEYATKEYIDGKVASLQQSISQVLDAVRNKNKTTM